jgi:hypothetical protein
MCIIHNEMSMHMMSCQSFVLITPGVLQSRPREVMWLEEGARQIILAPTTGQCFAEGDLKVA